MRINVYKLPDIEEVLHKEQFPFLPLLSFVFDFIQQSFLVCEYFHFI